jgi:hypothetical protein
MKAVVEDTDVVSFAFKGDTRVCLYASDLTNASLIVSFMAVVAQRIDAQYLAERIGECQ